MSVLKHRGGKKSPFAAVFWVIVAAVFVIVYIVDSGLFDGGSTDDTSGAVFGPRESGRLIERLDAAAKAQGICYGWRIAPGTFSAGPLVTPSFSGTFRPAPLPSAPAIPSAEPSSPAPPSPAPPSAASPSAVPSSPASPSAMPSSVASPVPEFSTPLFPPPTTPLGLGVESGSNLGIGTDPRTVPAPACAQWVVFTADYAYDSIEDEWTSVNIEVESNLARPPSTADLADAGITTASLLGDDAAARLADAIGALPMIVAEHGAAPAVPEATTATPPPGDQVATPGIGRYIWAGLAIILIIGGLLWIAVAIVRSRRQESPHA